MYIGVDLGSTNIKAAIYNKNFELIDRQSRPVEYIRENGFVEFDAVAYCEILVDLLRHMVRENGIKSIRQIAFTGQAESLVVLGADGNPLMNAISWMDERSTEECKILEKQFTHEICEAVTGQMAVLPTWPATKILWLQKNKPEVYAAADTYMLLKDYVVYYLTGVKLSDIAIITSDNPGSLRFHEKVGFRFIAEFPDCGLKFGNLYSVVWMEKLLNSGETPRDFPKPVNQIVNVDSFTL